MNAPIDIILALTDAVEKYLKKAKWVISFGPFQVEGPFSIEEKLKTNIDERIEKISEARNYLLDGLKAIDELESEASANRAELSRIISQLDDVRTEKLSAEGELIEIKKIKDSNVKVFRELAGIPNEEQKKRDRLIGFITGGISGLIIGIVASLIASSIWQILVNN